MGSPPQGAVRSKRRSDVMKTRSRWSRLLPALLPAWMAGPAAAADLDAGRATVQTVCAACHGANGVSVSDTIPNLAGQRAAYLENQLRALKVGTRRNDIMNAIAGQLGADDIANVAAFFASLPGVQPGSAKSAPLPNLAKTNLAFPEDYAQAYTPYLKIDFPATKQVRHYFASPAAVQAAKAGQPLPDGSVLLAEVWSAKLAADKKPVTGADGFYVADKLLFFTGMGRGPGWGQDIPEMLRNGDWNYAAWGADKALRPANQAECLACHKPLDKVSYSFTIEKLAAKARAQ
jgi:cytochrome c553